MRLIATDLDGTLLRSDLSISARSREAFARARSAGIVVVLVSARPPRSVARFAREAGVGGLAICSNGAITYDLDTEVMIESRPLESAVVVRLIHELRAALGEVCFGFERGTHFAHEPAWAALSAYPLEAQTVVGDALTLAGEPAVKLIVRHPVQRPEELLAVVQGIAGADAIPTYAGSPFLELSAPGVHKAAGLEALCTRLGIPAEDIVAFGDMHNDIAMLRWAGCGVAMANAHPEVLAAADAVTCSNDEDGVAIFVERLLDDKGCNAGS